MGYAVLVCVCGAGAHRTEERGSWSYNKKPSRLTRLFHLYHTTQDEEDDVDMYLKSLKRAEASGAPAPQGGGGGGPPKLSPEEVKRRNEEAKARMVRSDWSRVGLIYSSVYVVFDLTSPP